MPHRIHLTPEQRWTVICAPGGVSDEALARELGITRSAVHQIRWHFRRHGWSCRIVYTTCAWCERPLARLAKAMKPAVYHPACRPEALKAISQRIDRQRWASMSEDEQAAILKTLRNRDVTLHLKTMATARSSGRRWTDVEDLELIERADESAHVLAVDLGRTLFAVRSRRHVLRQRGRLGNRYGAPGMPRHRAQ